eukprot:scaffold88590_cov53-Attheya_sp.AAC.1
MMLSKTISAASVAILIMLVMVYYYVDESSLVLALLFALAVTNDYAMETIVISMLGLVLLAIIGIHIVSAGSSASAATVSIPSGNSVGPSTTRIDFNGECEELRGPRVRFDDDICIHTIAYSEEETTEKLQVIRQIYATVTEKQNIVTLAEEGLEKIMQTCDTTVFLHEIISLYEIQMKDDDDDDDRFEHVEEEEDTSNVCRTSRPTAPKRRRKSKLKRISKPRRSPRLMGAKWDEMLRYDDGDEIPRYEHDIAQRKTNCVLRTGTRRSRWEYIESHADSGDTMLYKVAE